MLIRRLKSDILKCKVCNIEKNITEYTRFKRKGEDEIMSKCTTCYLEHIKKFKEYKHQHYLKNKEKYNKKSKLYREQHKEDMKEYFKKHREQNKEKISAKKREHYQKNKKIINQKALEIVKKDPKKRILKSLRNRIIKVLRGTSKSDSTLKLLGCSVEDFKFHLEKQFYSDISWDNYGLRWHIDHIIPCAAYDLSIEEDQRKCFHYTNMRPLLAEENLSKNDKVIPELVRLVEDLQNETIHN